MAAEDAKAEEAKDVEMKDAKPAETAAEPEVLELETDAMPDSRPKVASMAFSASDCTLNVLHSPGMLSSVCEGGMSYLLAGTRATAGLKAGRHMFEARIIEMSPQPARDGKKHTCIRVGFSTAGSSLFLDDSDSVSFDMDGYFLGGKAKKRVAKPLQRDQVLAVVLNLDAGSPNANTVSLFKDGHRASEPQPLPEGLLGKALFPTITYRGATLQVNLGTVPLAPLPFACRMVGAAAAADAQQTAAAARKDGKFEVVFPVGLPEGGFFDWVDHFVKDHPDYTELSDRMVLHWAVKSGLLRPPSTKGASNDKPEMRFGIPAMDDHSVRRVLRQIAVLSPRNFIVPELHANLMLKDRKNSLARFSQPMFRKVAHVMLGEPTAAHRAAVQQMILEGKTAEAHAKHAKELAVKRAARERARIVAERQKKAEDARKLKLGEPVEPRVEEPEEEEEPPPMVELTEEEKKLSVRKTPLPDVMDLAMAKSYKDFSLPESSEGFDEIVYAWSPQDACGKLLSEWQFARKQAQRVDDITPGEWFKESWAKFSKSVAEWRKLQGEWKDANRRKAYLAKRAEAKKKEAEEKGLEEAPADPEINFEDLEVSSVADVTDVGNGEPLFSNFAFEDWMLLSTQFELHLLVHSFKKDLDDPDRQGFTEKDLPFYYNKYFKKTFKFSAYNVENIAQLTNIIGETMRVADKTNFLEALLPDAEDSVAFVRLVEEDRRARQRRLDAGDESAELNFPRTTGPAPPSHKPNQWVRTPQAAGSVGAAGGIRPGWRPALAPQRGPAASQVVGQKRPAVGAQSPWVAKQPRAATPSAWVAKR